MRNGTRRRTGSALAFGLLLWGAVPAFAQDDQVPPPPTADDLGVQPFEGPSQPEAPPPAPPAPSRPSDRGGAQGQAPSGSEGAKGVPLPETSVVETFGSAPYEEEPEPTPAAKGAAAVPKEYQIQPGDTLWDVCQKLLSNPWYWPKLWALNQYILNPHLIYPGNKLTFFSGSETEPPRLEIVDPVTGKPVPTGDTPVLKEPKEAEPGTASEAAPKGSEVAGPEGITFIGKKKMNVRLKTMAFISENDFDSLKVGEISFSGEPKMELYAGDRVYLKFRKNQKVKEGDRFHVVAKIKSVKDPDGSFGSVGIVVHRKAVIKVLTIRKEVVDGILVDSEDGVRRGDAITPYVSPFRTVTFHETKSPVAGRIVEADNGQFLISNNDFVFLNIGKKQGVSNGLKLVVVRKGDGVFQGEEEKKLPDVPVGHMVVVDTNETTSTAYVTSVRDSLGVGDRVRNEAD